MNKLMNIELSIVKILLELMILFAFGTKTGALGISDVSLYGPEVGLLGIVFNSLFILFLWRRSTRHFSRSRTG